MKINIKVPSIFALSSEITEVDINNFADLVEALKRYPEHKAAFIQPFLDDLDALKNLISCASDLIRLVKEFPNNKAALIQPFLDDPKVLIRIVTGAYDLHCFIECFPTYKTALIQPFLDSEILINLVGSVYDLKGFAKDVPAAYKIALIQPFLDNPEELAKLLKDVTTLQVLVNIFPACTVLQQGSIDQVIQKLKEDKLKQTSRTLYKIKYTDDSGDLATISDDAIKLIAEYTSCPR